VWPKTADGRPVKEAPVKENDHGCDALRYGVVYLDGQQPLTIPLLQAVVKGWMPT
jgi:hypothetical protein